MLYTYNNLEKDFIYKIYQVFDINESKAIAKICFENISKKSRLELLSITDIDELMALEMLASKVVDRLLKREPIQYILGQSNFYGLDLEVNSNVLIPRPETEELVDLIINENRILKKQNILDIGTGSGCIAIALSKNLDKTNKIFALDNCSLALDVARGNALINNCSIEFLEQNVLETFDCNLNFEVIVSNPPYILYEEIDNIEKHVKDYEPHNALFVTDKDPLQFYKAIINFSKKHLNKSGKLYFETHKDYHDSVLELLALNNFTAKGYKDISGNNRMVMATI